LKQDRLSPKLNSPSRVFIKDPSKMKVTMGADLSAVASQKFIPGGSGTFMTGG